LLIRSQGRSPYEDEVLYPEESKEGDNSACSDPNDHDQQYDDRGHPVNPEKRQWVKEYVRASNEVLQAAGIIESKLQAVTRINSEHQAAMFTDFVGNIGVSMGMKLMAVGLSGLYGFRRRMLVSIFF
jgi:hypothetical protein